MPQTPPPPAHRRTRPLVARLWRATGERMRQELVDAGHPELRPAHNVVLTRAGGDGARVTTMAAEVGATKVAVTLLVDQLEELGYVERVPDPEPLNPRDAIVKITTTAICGSDLHLYDGVIPTMRAGDILGHEFMGEVVATGSGVPASKLKAGDRVVVPFTIACGGCFFCQKSLWSLCDNSNPSKQLAEKLKSDGKILDWGVSNFDTDDIDELDDFPAGQACATNQIYYSLDARGPEFDLLPEQQKRGMPVMAYSPLGQGRLGSHAAVAKVAKAHGVTPAEVALAFVLSRPGVIAIPKAVGADHVRANRRAVDLHLGPDDMQVLDAAFPPPRRKQPLEMI